MPNTPGGLPYPVSTDPVSLGASNIQALAEAIDVRRLGGLSTTPPASPVAGQFWYFPADPAAGIVWSFRYNPASASPHKWEFVGGSRLAREGVGGMNWTAGEGTNSSVFGGLATPGPSLTLARAGDYVLEGQAAATGSAAGAAAALLLWIPSDGASVTWSLGDATVVAAATGYGATLSCRRTRAVVAGDTVELRYAGVGGTASYLNRSLWATPVRIS